ncbi:MAG: hypothetical protein COA79_14370 [Planctomycetota bacterium]|nr:MAG: hypothetical protein COA79_14370 [Planctomycetota bacterium]
MIKSKDTKHKYVHTREFLREQIESGFYPKSTCLPTFVQLQDQLNISNSTLLKALGDLEAEGLLVRRRGSGTWVADKSRAPLIPARQLNIAILYRDNPNPENFFKGFSASMLKGVLNEWGFDHQTPSLSPVQNNEVGKFYWEQKDRGLRVECLGPESSSRKCYPTIESVKAGNYDGLILLGINEISFIKDILKLKIPAILTDHPGHQFQNQADQIFVNPTLGYQEAVEYFLGKGLKNIHFLGALIGPKVPDKKYTNLEWKEYVDNNLRQEPGSLLRLNAWRNAMHAYGVPPQESQIHYETFKPTRIRKMLELYLASSPKHLPDAFICHSVKQAEVVLETFHDHGIEIEAAGASDSPHHGKALCINVEGDVLGSIASELIISRLTKKPKHHLSIGVNMNFFPEQRSF